MKRLLLASVLSMSCVHNGADRAFSPTMAPYVDSFRVRDFGLIPTDLSGTAGAPDAPVTNAADASNDTQGLKLELLEYAGLTPTGMCLLYGLRLAPSNDEPSATFVKRYSDELVMNPAGGMWIEGVESLKALSPIVPWPAPAASVPVTSVELRGDAKVTVTANEQVDGGGYTEVKHDYRILSLALCSAKPAITPATKFLVAGRHIAPGPNDRKIEDDVSGNHEEENEEIRKQHDVLFVWEISDHGKFPIEP